MNIAYWNQYIGGRKYYKDVRVSRYMDKEQAIANFFAIGGKRGWYYGNLLWKVRGWMDELVGGPGLRRGRKDEITLQTGDYTDFWRVLAANRQQGVLLLQAEMKVPGEAWLHFEVLGETLVQTAIYVPRGLAGELYWWSVWPFHGFIFPGMLQGIIHYKNDKSRL
ncbi:uncharacterized protein DUF2867 [Chitinophaga dinghuensis]|uniref:Uncharacterized protein DUF2867 n=1 Tax=Chitinophaga dinghuensis TaxID=1539050 RepID=A0A327W1N8_9BACT|nr:DUF2867 domain-containing protein [Chitinophaga dinghuensis]RAJ82186.1 uncharacterized protein DUF2867 [Chitinophaga dinghuensis]